MPVVRKVELTDGQCKEEHTDTAMEYDCVRKKPFNYSLNTVIEDDRTPREALTTEQEETLLSFAKNDRTYHE